MVEKKESKPKTQADKVLELLAGDKHMTHSQIAAKLFVKSLPSVYPAIAKLLKEGKLTRHEASEAEAKELGSSVGSWVYKKK